MTEQVAAPAARRGVRALLEPASVAVVGASPTNPFSRAALENLGALGFSGRVGAVNPRYDEILGVPCAPSLGELGFVPEAVVVAVNRERVVGVLEEAAQVGAAAAVVFGLGFAEHGEEGLARQRELQRIAGASGMAVLGPNCQGLINFASATALYMDTVRPYEPGAAALIAQSGSVFTALLNNRRGVRWRYALSSGNEAVTDAADLLWHAVEDPDCRVACLFLEAIRDPERFFAACDRALERDLPVIVLKTGRTEASMRAAEAHSGALAVPDRLVEALFERHGVIRVQTLEELLETANALQARQRPTAGTLATLTASGGQIELALDAAAAAGLEHPPLAQGTVEALERLLPDFLSAGNPLDYWGVDDPASAYPQLAELLADDPAVEIVLAVVDETDEPTGEGRFQDAHATALALAAEREKLFVVLDGVGGVAPAERIERTAAGGALLLSGFETGMRALGHLVAHSRRVAAPPRERVASAPGARVLPVAHSFSGATALDYLASAGVPVAPTRVVRGVPAALAAAVEVGFPVVAKLADDELTHKTEVGGVITGIADKAALRDAVSRLEAIGKPGVLIQPQVKGVELIVGVTRHPTLGSFLVVGLGGIWTELLQEVSIVPAGLAPGEAERLLRRLRGHELLDGARGTEPVDMAALVRLIERIDALALALGDQIASIDVNPVIAAPAGAWAVDALIVPA